MKTIEEGMVDARNQTLEGSSPGNQALAALQAETVANARLIAQGEADKAWRKRPADPGQAAWGKKDYRYVDAYCAGTNLETGELPNRYFAPNAVNVAGFDLATGNKMKSVVDKAYEGNAFYGVGQLSRSHTNITGVRPPTDIIGLSAVAAAMQAKGLSYEDYERGLPGWDVNQLQRSWNAGTDSLRHAPVVDKFTGWINYGPAVSVHPPDPKSLDFDVRMGDKEFQKAGRTIYQHFNGTPFKDTDAAAARWLAGHMRDLDWNTALAAGIMLKGKNATWDTHQAYITAIEAWSQTNMERAFLPQMGNILRLVTDPANLWGTPIGKLTINTASRFVALEFFKRMLQSGAVAGATGAVTQEVVKANLQAKDPTGTDLALAAAGGVVAGEGIPLFLQEAGKAVKRGINALKRPDMPDLPPNNVLPRPTGEGTYIPAAEAPKPAEAAARVVGDPTMAEADAGNLTTAEGRPINLAQQPYEGAPGFTDALPVTAGQADEMLGGPPVAQVEDAQAAAQALPVETARPAPPRDPASRVFIDPATGYYSPIQKAVVDAQSSKQTPEQWMNGVIKKAQFFKQDELEWLDLDKFFKGKDSVTKEELLAHIDENLVKIQRHPLVPQRRNTVSWEDHLLRNNPEYGRLHAEKAEQLDLAALAAAEPEMHVHQNNAFQLDLHMRRVAVEERKALMAAGAPPPNVHGIEHMLTEFDTGTEIETREILDRIFAHLKSEQTHQDLLTRARSPAVIAQLKATIASDQRIVQDIWKDLEGMAANVGAVIRPSDLERVYGMINYGDPQVRDYSILGTGMRGTQYTQGGIDPIGHQIALYRHPEGLQASGTSGHPGGDTPGTLGWAITSERNLSNGETIRFVDEGQSDLAKERRRGEKEYVKMKQAVDADPALDFDSADALRKSEDYDDYVWQVYLASKFAKAKSKLPEHWRDATPRQRDAMLQKKDVWGLGIAESEDVPAMPKHIFYSTVMSSIFKSELYNAALDGKDHFGWATSDIIQNRYGARPHVLEGPLRIQVTDNGLVRIHVLTPGAPGYGARNAYVYSIDTVMEFADKLEGDAGSALRKQAHEAERLAQGDRGNAPGDIDVTLDKPLTVKPGAYWAYDVQIKKEMQKFVEKYGGEVVPADMPVAPGSGDTVKVWTIKIDAPLRKKLLEQGVPIGAAAGAAVTAGQEEEAMQ